MNVAAFTSRQAAVAVASRGEAADANEKQDSHEIGA